MKKFSLLFFLFVLFFCNTKAQLVVFGDNYGAGISFAAFGGSVNTLSVDNSQFHSGTASLKIPVTSGYTGGALVSAAPTDLSSYNAVTFWAKNDQPAYKLDGVGLGNNSVTTVFACERNGVTLSSTWTKYYIPIPVASKLTAETGLFHFAEGSGEGAYNIWIDDIQYENVGGGIIGIPTAAFATETQNKNTGDNFNANGTTSSYPVNSVNQDMQTSKAYFTWTSSNLAVATFDAFGVGTALTAGTTNITGMLGSVAAAGVLTVNVTAATGPATAAPTPPGRAPADVISIYSGAYTNLAGTNFNPNWGQATVVSEVNIVGNPTRKYASLNYQGTEFAPAIDATGMIKLHLDIWTADCTAFDVFLINPGNEKKVTITPTASGWKSVDLDLSDFTAQGILLNNIIQFKYVGTPGTGSTVFLDNIYFYKGVVAPTDPTIAAPAPPVRASVDVLSLFSAAYSQMVGIDWFPNWGQSTIVSDVTIAGDLTKKYANLNYQGTTFSPTALDVSDMTHLHMDLWTPDCTAFDVYMINPGPVEQKVTLTPTLSGWNSFDINMSDYTTIAKNNIFQFKFVGTPSGSKVYLDNIYFWKGSPLPVTLSDFKVSKRGNTTVINWKTFSEINSKGFSVERSSNGTDWAQLQFVSSNGNSNTAKQYGAVDNTPLKGINYYRLKQVDIDGKFTYSPTATLTFAAKGSVGFSFYPNPAKDRVKVSLESIGSKTASLQLVNTDGKTVKNMSLSDRNSNTDVFLDVTNITRGVYLLILRDGQTINTSRILID